MTAGARQAEPQVSADMRRIEGATGARLEGYENRLKGDESFRSKMYDELRDAKGGVDDALHQMKDSIRYTFTADDAQFVDKVADVRHALSDAGYTEVKFKNTFGGDGYQGINASYQSPHGGGSIEVQFHTPASFDAKMQAHDLYDVAKGNDVPTTVLDEIQRRSDEIFGQVPQPPGGADQLPGTMHHPWNLGAGGIGAAGSHAALTLDRLEENHEPSP